MIKILRKYNKKLLAIFAALLMIVFILPSTFGRGSGQNRLVGTIDGEHEVRQREVFRAHEEWELLNQFVHVPDPNFGREAPLTLQQLGPMAYQEISDHPELFYLLQQEAERLRVNFNRDDVQTILTNLVHVQPQDPVAQDRLRSAIEHFLLVNAAYQRAASAIKVSEPHRQNAIAQNLQQIKVNLVEFSAGEFAGGVAAPTTQQVQEQYEKFADVNREDPASQREGFGFGYKYPDRVKIGYIMLPQSEVRKAVRAKRSDYEWEVEAFKYYSRNPSQYQAPPATQPATDELSLGGTTTQPAAASTQPTTRPFSDVKNQVIERLVSAETEKLQSTIQNEINSILRADWHASRNAAAPSGDRATTQPTTGPATGAGSGIGSHEYLQQVAARIQKQFKVLPAVTTVPEFRSFEELTKLPNIGEANVEGMQFATYVMSTADAFVPAAQKDNANVLSPLEPSPALRDFGGNTYVFRVTEAEPAHQPRSIDEVAGRVQADVKTKLAYDKALEAAKSFTESATTSGLSAAANTVGRKVITTGAFRNTPGASAQGYPLEGAAKTEFIRKAFGLLAEAKKTGKEHPVLLIELPQAQRVIVAELESVESMMSPETMAFADLQVRSQIQQELEEPFRMQWFAFDAVKKRLNYEPAAGAVTEHTEDDGHNHGPTPQRPRPLGT